MFSKKSLSKMTTFQVGGPTELLALVQSEVQLRKIAEFGKEFNLPLFVLGKGSNVLFDDSGFMGIVIRLKKNFQSFNPDVLIYSDPIKYATTDSMYKEGLRAFWVGAGVSLNNLVRFGIERSLTGIEDLAGIPGTVGGGIFMNASAGETEISKYLSKIRVYDLQNDNFYDIPSDQLKFSYRHVEFPEHLSPAVVITKALFTLKAGDQKLIKQRVKETLANRKERLPQGRSAGSVFKNPPGLKAWKLIEDAGLKGFRVGGAIVSEKHGNVILNYWNANASEIRHLISYIKLTVFQKFQVELIPEIKIITRSGEIYP
ncbi:MAG: UDP-N-acetylmuramate dehydrogenase [Deltaproteobacteria bacterium]|nr:UDP-N-acetylmuramate dehydrogenase [Deltaproteobacteria bacterium]